MDEKAIRDMREALGLSRMLWMPDPTQLGYERDDAQIPGDDSE